MEWWSYLVRIWSKLYYWEGLSQAQAACSTDLHVQQWLSDWDWEPSSPPPPSTCLLALLIVERPMGTKKRVLGRYVYLYGKMSCAICPKRIRPWWFRVPIPPLMLAPASPLSIRVIKNWLLCNSSRLNNYLLKKMGGKELVLRPPAESVYRKKLYSRHLSSGNIALQ